MHAGTAYTIVLTHIFFHPDYTVGPRVSLGQRTCLQVRSRTIPPVGNFTPP